MTGRDRMVLMGLVLLAVLAGGWLLVVSPERKQAAEQEAQVASARTQLQGAQAQAASARTAETRYESAYTSVVSLGKAVPPLQEVPSLVYELDQASSQRDVDFNSISSGASGSSGSSSSSSPAAAASATPAAFTQMPFTFVFNGSFADLYHLFRQLDKATVRTSSGGLRVSGRLLTLQGMKLQPGSGASSGDLTGTITATAYVLPASSGLTGGSTSAAPASPGTGSATAASGSAPSSSAPPAVVTAGATR
jgi:Tfp pilus assembly protein PilO